MAIFALQVEFMGDPPDLSSGDILLPPRSLEIDGYVRMKRGDGGRIQLVTVRPEALWGQEERVWQVERGEDIGGYRLRPLPPGGVHAISIQALRRIRGHGVTVIRPRCHLSGGCGHRVE